jgi:hypothetical protein
VLLKVGEGWDFVFKFYLYLQPLGAIVYLNEHQLDYKLSRGPQRQVVSVRIPRSLSADISMLTLAYKGPKHLTLLRIIEE